MKNEIAIIGMACKYPDANSYQEFWGNILAQRRAFRKIPDVRLNAAYFSDKDEDKIRTTMAAVLRDYTFDRKKYNISGEVFRGTDLTHWLALDVASEALEDAGLLQNDQLPKDKVGVYVGNTLTGEFSRANTLRLRWPYVQRKLLANLHKLNLEPDLLATFMQDMETDYKSAFPKMFEDSLAGGLSNTIAGRICNYYDFHGGGYTVDGACSSSLLAVIDACRHIAAGDNEICIAGGVDLSLDPFELVGFSRAGALASKEMLIYDKDANGFWPGEGCGFVVLSTLSFARSHNLKIHGLIKGYGISSDGQGGLTRPSVNGQRLAMERAYARAGYQPDKVAYFEGHGTGTVVGDQVELQTLLGKINPTTTTHYIGSVKGNIGHTKAAAGIAGLIKITNVVKNRIIPPVTGCRNKNNILDGTALHILFKAIPYQDQEPMRASVSAMGFGGINTHITIEEYQPAIPQPVAIPAAPDTELFLFAADTPELLLAQLETVSTYVKALSFAELGDLGMQLMQQLQPAAFRAAIVAASPAELSMKLQKLIPLVTQGHDFVENKGYYYNAGITKPRIGYLFPGQGSKRFATAGRFKQITIPGNYPAGQENSQQLDMIQAGIVGTSMIGLRILEQLGVQAEVGIGHSLGEISALHWSGYLDEEQAIQLAQKRGEIMHDTPGIDGLMLIVPLPADRITLKNVEIAAINSPTQTVLSGTADNINACKADLLSQKVPSMLLPVRYAFHNSRMKKVEDRLRDVVRELPIQKPSRKMFSTVSSSGDVKENLVRQLASPVLFMPAFQQADERVDLWIEVGGDKTLTPIARDLTKKPVAAIMMDGQTTQGLCETAGLVWTAGTDIQLDIFIKDRPVKPFDINWQARFIANPCEDDTAIAAGNVPEEVPLPATGLMASFSALIAQKLELPVAEIDINARFLDDLHLNSLQVGQLIAGFASSQKIVMQGIPTEYANASISEVVAVLSLSQANDAPQTDQLPGIEPWVHFFDTSYINTPLKPGTLPGADGIFLNLIGCSNSDVLHMLPGMLTALREKDLLVIIQDRPLLTGFVKSLFLDKKTLRCVVINTDVVPDETIINSEVNASKGFTEVKYIDGVRYTPLFSPVFNYPSRGPVPLTEKDVILVSGGAKGITAECALSLATKYSVKLLLIGRATNDDRLRQSLERFDAAGITYEYHSVDICDEDAISKVIQAAVLRLGPITGVIHGAGRNIPTPWFKLTADDLQATVDVKINGFRNLVTSDLKLLITFGSVIAETGMNGNADYALANEWLREEVARYAADHPACFALNAAWSVWSGAGMGEHLGVLENLVQQGIQPISLEKGVDIFMSWMEDFPFGHHLIISGRYGKMETLKTPPLTLPLYRFLGHVRLLYPGIELITEFELSAINDLYLKDHMLNGGYVFPAVMGLECMRQVAAAFFPAESNYTFLDTSFNYPIILPEGETQTIRVIALRLSPHMIKIVIRSSATGYGKDHFETCITVKPAAIKPFMLADSTRPALDVAEDLYGQLLFHQGIFQVISHYDALSPYQCAVTLLPPASINYFGEFLSPDILSTSPVARDAALHCIQACVPDYRLLPTGVKRIYTVSKNTVCRIEAKEISKSGNIYTYDLSLLDEEGQLVEYWDQVTFQAFTTQKDPVLPLALVEVIAQRRMDEISGQQDSTDWRQQDHILRRYDGKPTLKNYFVSRTHLQDLTLQLKAGYKIGCDLEKVTSFKDTLLGKERYELARFVSTHTGEELSITGTRIWGIMESLKKAGLNLLETILFEKEESAAIQYYKCGQSSILSIAFKLKDVGEKAVFTAVLGDIHKNVYSEKI
jgi:enediyne polyketide synthase